MGSEENIRQEDFDKELEQLLNSNEKKEGKKKGSKKKKIILAAGALAVAAIVGSRLLGGQGTKIPAVDTITPEYKKIQNRLQVSGPVSGTDSVDVVSNLHAEVLEIPVKEGDKVTKGQILAVLDDTEIKKEAEIAKNDYDLAVSTCTEQELAARHGYEKAVQDLNTAQANYDRTKFLYDDGSVPLVELEAAGNSLNDARREKESFILKDGKPAASDSYRLQAEKAKFAYEKKQEELEDTKIKSPIDGTVVRVNTKVGRYADMMEDNEPMFMIENLDVLEMEIKVSEYSIGNVEVGQEAEISADILGGTTVKGQVTSISPTGEEKGGGSTERVIPATIRIMDDNTKLIAGITAKAQIVLEEAENALTIPVTALMEQNGETYVLAVRENKIDQIPVDLGVEGEVEVEIIPKDGEVLDDTTPVVAVPNASYTEGMEVLSMPQ